MTALSLPEPLDLPQDEIRSPWKLARKRFLKNRLAVLGAILLLLMIAACFLTIPYTTGRNPGQSTGQTVARYADQLELHHVREAPSQQFWMGTDLLGRDLLSRFLLGGAISLSIGIASTLIAILIGTSVGVIAGYVGGTLDAFLMRIVDVMYGLPYILLVILMRVSLVPPLTALLTHTDKHGASNSDSASQWANILVLLFGIGSVSWLTMARVVRGQVMGLRDLPFVEAARAMGLGRTRILLKHVLPNLVGTIVVYGTLTVPNAILSESFLSFLGLGIQDPLPSWGNLASQGIDALNPIHIRWWLILWPCLGLSLALLSLNFLGDGIQDALDPKAV